MPMTIFLVSLPGSGRFRVHRSHRSCWRQLRSWLRIWKAIVDIPWYLPWFTYEKWWVFHNEVCLPDKPNAMVYQLWWLFQLWYINYIPYEKWWLFHNEVSLPDKPNAINLPLGDGSYQPWHVYGRWWPLGK